MVHWRSALKISNILQATQVHCKLTMAKPQNKTPKQIRLKPKANIYCKDKLIGNTIRNAEKGNFTIVGFAFQFLRPIQDVCPTMQYWAIDFYKQRRIKSGWKI